jgi:hypothetical protein
MNPTEIPLSERVAKSIQKLSVVASDLNNASDELGRAISAIDVVLQSLNIGVPTWTTIIGGDDERDYWRRELGYAKLGNRWGVALQTVHGDHAFPEDERSECWFFNDAPRWLRIEGVAKIPDLLDALITRTEEATKKIRTKTAEAKELAVVIAEAAGKKPPQGGK